MSAATLHWVPYGRAAARALASEIEAFKSVDPLAPVTVVVPSNQVGVSTRRLLASGVAHPSGRTRSGIVAVTFVTPYRLAEQRGAPVLAGSGRRPVSVPLIAAAVRRALTEQPGMFAPVAAHPATESALVATYRELREASAAQLDQLAATGPRAAEVVRLHRAARARLEPHWYDEQDLVSAATAALRAGGAGDLGSIVVYLPQVLTPHVATLLTTLASTTPTVILAGTTGVAAADAEVVAAVRRLVPHLPAPPGAAPLNDVVTPTRTAVVATSDADEEVRHAVRAIVDAARRGIPLDRIAMLHAAPEPYARLAHEQLAAAGIASNGPAIVPLSARLAGRVLLDAFALADRGFRRQDLFAWLATAPVRVDGRPAPVLAWERLSREAGVVSGDDWRARLDRHAAQLDERATRHEHDPDAPAWRAERYRSDAARSRSLSAFVTGLRRELAPEQQPRSWSAHATWAVDFLHEILGPSSEWDRWAEADEQRAAVRVVAAAERLGALGDLEEAVPLDVFARTLAMVLDSDLGRVGRFGDGVLVGPIALAIGIDLDLVIVLGLAEGTFPAPVRDDSLLPDHERAAAGTALAPRGARVERQHRELLAALAGGERQLLTFPRGDLRRSAERIPSRWLLDVASHLVGRPVWSGDLVGLEAPDWLTVVASFDSGLRSVEFPATEQEHRLRTLMASGGQLDGAVDDDDDVLGSGAALIAARRSDRFTRFDGHVTGVQLPSPTERPTSASRVESWARCPFAYFMLQVLGVEGVENPEDQHEITPLDRGNLVHEALERFIVAVLDRPVSERPAPDQAWSPADRELLARIGAELCDRYEAEGRTGRPLFWGRDRARILTDLDRFLTSDDHYRRARRTRPAAAELAFGMGTDLDAVSLPLPDGRQLRFRGLADRIDIAEDGTLHVVDYKTGKDSSYSGLSADNPDEHGTRLQLPIYGAAARAHQGDDAAPVRAEYWFVSDRGQFRRIGYDITPDVMERVSATLGTIVAGIEAGVFTPHPSVGASSPWVECECCDPDALGVVDLHRAWERKRHDPALTVYADLAEPPPEPPPEPSPGAEFEPGIEPGIEVER